MIRLPIVRHRTRFQSRSRAQRCLLACLWAAQLGAPAWSADATFSDPAQAEEQLTEIRKRIGDLEGQIQSQVKARGATEQSLREAERDEAQVRQTLRSIGAELDRARERLAELETEAERARIQLGGHSAELAQQLRLAYVAGREDWLRSVLSQRDPIEIGRQLVYHSYFAKQRSSLIDTVRSELANLEVATDRVDQERARLETIEASERDRLDELTVVRERRKLALVEINAAIASRAERVERLRVEAADLETLVAELTRLLADLPIDGAIPFGERKGQMDWPVAGRVVRKFGQSRGGGRLRWQGVLLTAPAGGEVRAVHHGRVVFSDWLPGMGMLIILEHGDGYLSLYGHNQDLMTDVGEWVDPDTVIAHVGDSGGQAVAGLYFEIRKGGKPQNPGQWIGQ